MASSLELLRAINSKGKPRPVYPELTLLGFRANLGVSAVTPLRPIFKPEPRHQAQPTLNQLKEPLSPPQAGCHCSDGPRAGPASGRAALTVSLLVPLGEFQENHFLALVVAVVEDPVRPDAKTVLGDELGDDKFTCKPFRPLTFGPRIVG
jgi:hypothetical protein